MWALGLATAASRTTNPLILGLVIAVATLVVVARRGDAPWARSFRLYVWVGVFVVVMRVAFRVVFGGGSGGTVLVPLPTVGLPGGIADLTLFGPVTAEAVLGGFYDGLRLATMIICVGAANALANPKRLLKAVPGALSEVGTAVVVALSVFPQLAESVLRVRRARRLRGGAGTGLRAWRGIVVPVLEDALDRSLQLAAAMDSRGYGRAAQVPPHSRLLAGTFTITGLVGVCIGIYGLLDGTAPTAVGAPMLALGLVLAAVGFRLAGRRVQRTHYRPDTWRAAEVVTAASGVAVAAFLWLALAASPADINPSLDPLAWPEVTTAAVLAVLVGAVPAVATPRTPLTAQEVGR